LRLKALKIRLAYRAARTAWVFPALIALCIIAASCGGDDGGGGELHWFDCQPVLEKLASCDIAISLNGADETDPDTAYDSCQFARGNMWLRMFKCYNENESCEDLAQCLPEHGFMTPETDDDTADDDVADDDTSDDDTMDDDTADDDTADDDTSDDDSA
jgi:hypothetical protein